MERPTLRPKLIGGVALLLLDTVIGAGVALLLSRQSVRSAVDRVLLEAWRPIWGPDANVLLCAATPLHLVAGPEGHKAYGSPTYPRRRKPIRSFASTAPSRPATNSG
jgi:hypothetical protein